MVSPVRSYSSGTGECNFNGYTAAAVADKTFSWPTAVDIQSATADTAFEASWSHATGAPLTCFGYGTRCRRAYSIRHKQAATANPEDATAGQIMSVETDVFLSFFFDRTFAFNYKQNIHTHTLTCVTSSSARVWIFLFWIATIQ